ncbi:MAG: hypothetical protein FWC36_01715 [Spirochaetes bacterium]|nr:hypothetical protein [Spirochaetota bacterium]
MANADFQNITTQLAKLNQAIIEVKKAFESFGKTAGNISESLTNNVSEPLANNAKRFRLYLDAVKKARVEEELQAANDRAANDKLTRDRNAYFDGQIKRRQRINILLNEELNAEQRRQELFNAVYTKMTGEENWGNIDKETQKAIIAKLRKWAAEKVEAFDTISGAIKEHFGIDIWKEAKNLLKEYHEEIIRFGKSKIVSLVNRPHAALKERLEKDRKALDEFHNQERRRLNREMQERLFALGVVGAATEAQHEADLQAAIESGDQRRIFEAKTALKKHQVQEEFAEKQRDLDEYIARQKAELQYKADLAGWRMQVNSAIALAAQAVANAAVNKWPFPALAMVGKAMALGGRQIATVKGARPVLQFATGGIVPGISFTGDRVLARVNSGEMVINREQQKRLFDAIEKGSIGSEAKTVTIPVYLDGKKIAESTVNLVNNRQFLIKQGSVI